MSERSLAAEIGDTYVFEELQRASDEAEQLRAENARLRRQVQAAVEALETMEREVHVDVSLNRWTMARIARQALAAMRQEGDGDG